MIHRACLILPLFILLTVSLHSQNIIFKTYTVNEGLVANPIRKVLQDSKGFLWIATWEGLSKYDGNKFTNYNTSNGLSFDLVNDLYEDSSGRIYLAENNGCLDIIEHNHITRDTVHREVVVNNFFRAPRDKIFAATDDKGLLQFNDAKWTIPQHQQFTTIMDFAVLTDSLNVIINTDLKPCLVDQDFNSYSAIPVSFIASGIRRDSKNRVWLCTSVGIKLLSSHQQKGKSIKFDPLPQEFEHPALRNQVTDLFEDIDGNYWISTLNGLVRIDNHGRVQLFTTSNGLPINIVNNFYQDRERNIWMCSQAGLIKIVMKNNLQYFGRQDGLETDEVLSIFSNSNGLYLNNANHVLKIDRQKNVLLAAPEVSPNSNWPAIDKNGNCYTESDSGIIMHKANKSIGLHVLPFRITALIIDDQGHLWAGTWRDGLYRLTRPSPANDTLFDVQDLFHLVPDKSIRSIFMDHHGNTWIGTRYNGVYRLKPSGYNSWMVMNFDRKNGMNSNWVKAIAEDRTGNIWVGTLQGLNKLIPENDSFRIFDFSRINHSYGAVNCIYTGIDHEIWYGGPSGLVRFRDDKLDTLTAPDVFLTTIQSKKQLSFTDDERNRTVFFPYYSNQINFEFSAPSFINEKEIMYSYRLRGGVDTSWSAAANLHSVSYASLSPGNYRYEVRAIGWNGLPGRTTVFSFTIKKPFWQARWFYVLAFLLMLCLGYSLYRYRINQLVKVQKVRDRIATDLHDDIGSSLTNINILSELSYQNISRPEHAQKFLQRISEEVGNTSQAMDDIIWNVNSKNDSVRETFERMRRFAAELFDHSTVQYHLELDDAIHGKKINMEQRRDVFLMYKEMLNNVYKHARADQVWIMVKLSGNILHLDIRDDGQGFDSTVVTKRNGLKNLHQRSARWSGDLKIESRRGKGTNIHISLPLQD